MATYTIKNITDLIKILESRICLALKMTQDEIYKVIQEHVCDYYKEPVFNGYCIPSVYERQYKFLNSLIKTKIIIMGNSIFCTVEVDPNYLSYTYVSGGQGFTGEDVWNSANEQFHGWSVEGDMQVWNDSMSELGLDIGINKLMKKNLKKCGVPVK